MLKNIFAPAIALLNRLDYTRKFTLLWLMSLVAIAVMMYSLFASMDRVIQPSERQLQGIDLIKPIYRVLQLIQLHRGLSVASLGGDHAMQDRRAATELKVADAFKALEEGLPPGFASREDFKAIKAGWERLRKQGLHLTTEENFAAHTRLIGQIRDFGLRVADEYLLVMDPEIATFYMIDTAVNKLPHVLERLGQLRAFGTVILEKKRITEPEKSKLNQLLAELDSSLKEFNGNMEMTARHNPAVRNSLLSVSNDIFVSATQIADTVASDILTRQFATPSDAFLDMATARIDKAYAQMHDVLLPTAETLIKARIAQAKSTLIFYIGGALLLFLVGVYISASIYYAIIGNIHSLVRSLSAFAEGDLSVRVNLGTRDELSQVGKSFNEMAQEFSALIETHREDEARLRATIETAMDAVVQMDETGAIIGWNSQAEKVFGWGREEAIGRSLNETIIPHRHRQAHANGLKRFLITGEGPVLNSWFEIAALHRDGHEFPVELSIAPIKTAGKYEFSAFIRDITERKRTEAEVVAINAELAQANVQIEEERAQLATRVEERTVQLMYANHAKDAFLATMSHEIRTPLGGLLGMLELISLSPLDDKQSEMLEAARDSGRSLLRIVNDILDWSKIEAAKLELAPQAATIPEVMKGVVSTYSPLASAKGLLLRQHIDSKLSGAHIFDSLRLSQILHNFTSNAIKFTEQGSVEISVELIAQHEGSEQLRFCVRDSGVGISQEQQAHLFQFYEQATADTARMYGGTGLGLAICRSLVALMEGTISVESTPGHGSCFCFTLNLPIASPAEQHDLQSRQAMEGRRRNMPDLTPLATDGSVASVLVVDDHPINRMLLKQQLELLGMNVVSAANGIVALSLWQADRFDLIFTDCHMHGMDGYELTRSIREKEQFEGRQGVPIIAFTANVLAEEEARCRAAGMDDILTKPVDMTDLRAMLLRWLPKAGKALSPSPAPGKKPVDGAQAKIAADTPIDFSVLKKIAAGHAAQVEMLREFSIHNSSDIAELKAALRDGNPAALARSIHRIRGASNMVGAIELEGVCTAIEKAAVPGGMEAARLVANTALDKALERIDAAIRAFTAGQ